MGWLKSKRVKSLLRGLLTGLVAASAAYAALTNWKTLAPILSSETAAAWAQALGTVGAIWIAIWLSFVERKRDQLQRTEALLGLLYWVANALRAARDAAVEGRAAQALLVTMPIADLREAERLVCEIDPLSLGTSHLSRPTLAMRAIIRSALEAATDFQANYPGGHDVSAEQNALGIAFTRCGEQLHAVNLVHRAYQDSLYHGSGDGDDYGAR